MRAHSATPREELCSVVTIYTRNWFHHIVVVFYYMVAIINHGYHYLIGTLSGGSDTMVDENRYHLQTATI